MSIMSGDDWRTALTWTVLPSGRAWQRVAGAAIVRPGLSFSAAASLLVIARLGDGARQMDVAEEAVIDRAAIARSVSQLERQGYILRRTDDRDARAKTLHLTDAGRLLADELAEELDATRRRVLASVSDEDGEAALRVLLALQAAEADNCIEAVASRQD